MKHVFIVNPKAGGGKSLKIVENIERIYKRDNKEYVIHYTKEPMDAMRITKEYEKLECVIFSVGGDGTMNEVLNGIIGSKNLFSVIPAGSGNDFTRALESIDELEFSIDVGKINERYFVNVVCIGIDAEVASNANIMKAMKVPPSQIYNASIIYTFIKYRFKKIECYFNNLQKVDKFTLIAICNGRYYGGGFKIAPKAKLTDGLFDIYFVNKISKIKIPKLFLKLVKGTHEEIPTIEKSLSDSLIIRTEKTLICNVDGETLKGKEFNIKTIKNAVRFYNNKELVGEILKNYP